MNGSKGIGTGWSSTIPSYRPADVVDQLRRLIRKEPLKEIHPWYRGFQGSIEWRASSQHYKVRFYFFVVVTC